ncbi:MAG: hypothetical protein WA056_02235 [Gallionella sp.]
MNHSVEPTEDESQFIFNLPSEAERSAHLDYTTTDAEGYQEVIERMNDDGLFQGYGLELQADGMDNDVKAFWASIISRLRTMN